MIKSLLISLFLIGTVHAAEVQTPPGVVEVPTQAEHDALKLDVLSNESDIDALLDMLADLEARVSALESEEPPQEPTEPEEPAAGWTEFQESADTNVIHLSTSGDDTNPCTQADPCKTLAHGYNQLRDGMPDWLLLKRGDTWIEERFTGNWDKSGRSETEPMLISAYGTGERPTLLVPSDVPGIKSNGGPAHLAFVGLRMEPYQRPASEGNNGIRWLGAGEDILFEDMYLSGFNTNLVFQELNGGNAINVRLRRNVIVDAWSATSHSQGLYAKGVKGLLLEENLFDHNGWNESVADAEPTKFNHNIYIKNQTKDVIAWGNIFSRAAATGMQARSGGVVEDNLFVGNPLGLNWGPAQDGTGGVGGRVEDNVIVGCVDRGYGAWGLAIGNIGSAFSADVNNNLIGSCEAEVGIGILLAGHNLEGIHGLNLTGNVVFDARLPLRVIGEPDVHLKDIVLADNTLQNHDDARKELVQLRDMRLGTGAFQFSGNSYYSPRSESSWFKDADGEFGIDRWMTEEPDAVFELIQFPDSDRSVGSYSASIGGDGSLEAFLTEARSQSKTNWRTEYTAKTVKEYIMEGFGMTEQ